MDNISFVERQSRAIRLWHWLTVIVTALILFTVFAGKFVVNGWHTGQTIDATTRKFGTTLTREQIGQTVTALRSGLWKWHIYFGYALSVLFAFRLLIEAVEGKLWKSIRRGVRFTPQKGQGKTRFHFLLVKFVYVLVYGLLGTIVGTGLWMAYYRGSNAVSFEHFHDIKEIHETCFNFLLLFIFIHLIGLIRAERGRHKNIISGMVHG